MIAHADKPNFIVAHYDWLVAGVGVLALIGGAVFFALSLGEDPGEAAAAEVNRINRLKPRELGVKDVDMTEFVSATRVTKSPVTVAEIAEKSGSFLASDRRVICSGKECHKVIPGSAKECPFCHTPAELEKPVVLDADSDGLPDEWEKRNGFNPNDAADASADSDGDGFTNLEEFAAKTDPKNKNDHPDYLDSLAVQLPLKQTYMPFVFCKATKIPGSWRCEFRDPARKNDYGRMGRIVRAKVGEKIVDTDGKEKVDYGFTVKSYEEKSEKRERKGMAGMLMTVDVSEVTVVRERDGKAVTLVVQPSGAKLAPVDVQATLVYTRGTVQNFEVTPGSEIDLNGTKYRISAVKTVGKGAEVTVENALSGTKRTLRALEQ